MRSCLKHLAIVGLYVGISCLPIVASTNPGGQVMKSAYEKNVSEIQKLKVVSSILDERSSGFTKTERITYSVIAMSGAVIAIAVAARTTHKKQ